MADEKTKDKTLSEIVKRIARDKENATPRQALLSLIARIDRLLPDGSGGGTLVEDVKTLAKATGDDFASILPDLLKQLMRIVEHGGARVTCWHAPVHEKEAAGEILNYLLDDHAEIVALFSIHLETLAMRMLTTSYAGSRWAATAIPRILRVIKIKDGLRYTRSLWSAYWPAVRVEIECNTSERDTRTLRRAAVFIESVRDCIKVLGAEGITASEGKEMGGMLKSELCKWNARSAQEEGHGHENDERILKSIAESILIGCEKFDSLFLSILRPLFPLLVTLLTNFTWSSAILEMCFHHAPEFRELIRSSANRDSSVADSSSLESTTKNENCVIQKYAPSSVSSQSSSSSSVAKTSLPQKPIEFDAFVLLFSEWSTRHSVDQMERNFIEKKFEAVPHHVKATFLWRLFMMNRADKERMELMKTLESVVCLHSKKIFSLWSQDTTIQFCAQLLREVQGESNEELRKGLSCITGVAATNQLVLDRSSGYHTQQWIELLNFIWGCEEPSNDLRLQIVLEMIGQTREDFLGEALPLLAPLIHRSLLHDKLTIRLDALHAYKNIIKYANKNRNEFVLLLPIIMAMVERDSRNVNGESKIAMECLADGSLLSVHFLLPVLIQLFDLCTKLLSDDDHDRRSHSAFILTCIFKNPWDTIIPILKFDRIDGLSKALIRAIRVEQDAVLKRSINEIIAETAGMRRRDSMKSWTELPVAVSEFLNGKDCGQWYSALLIISKVPDVINSADDETAMNLKKAIIEGSSEENRFVNEAAMGAISALASECEKRKDDRLKIIVSDIIRTVIKVTEELPEDTMMRGIRGLSQMEESSAMVPHLSSFLHLLHTALSHGHKLTLREKEWLRQALRRVNGKISSKTTVNLFCTVNGDKTAFVPSIDIIEKCHTELASDEDAEVGGATADDE